VTKLTWMTCNTVTEKSAIVESSGHNADSFASAATQCLWDEFDIALMVLSVFQGSVAQMEGSCLEVRRSISRVIVTLGSSVELMSEYAACRWGIKTAM